MKSLENVIKDCLFDYVRIILKFEKALMDTYNLQENPYQCQRLFPRIGKVMIRNEVFDYRFHGAGCSFTYSDLEVHYDYYIPDDDYIMTVPWKFWRFVATSLQKSGGSEITIDEVADTLESLNNEGVIQKRLPDYLQYQIKFSWFENYSHFEQYG
jgi:hypothetical protein